VTTASPFSRLLGLAAGVAAGVGLAGAFSSNENSSDAASDTATVAGEPSGGLAGEAEDGDGAAVEVVNWSATHVARPRRHVEPATLAELESAVAQAHAEGAKLRPVGAAISPNGLGFSDEGMLSLAQLDQVLWVDKEARLVRVQAGARVQQVVEALRPHGLTLENYASIKWQMIGGYTQTGAHGTGATLPPVDEQVVSMKLVTPAEGTMELSSANAKTAEEAELFRLARVGLGALGVVAELTLRCVPAHRLVETTRVVTRAEARAGHAARLRRHRHVRYMWIPYEDAVVVVTCDPVANLAGPEPTITARLDSDHALEPLRDLLRTTEAVAPGTAAAAAINTLNFAALRDRLLAAAPLDAHHVRACNRAEAEFWRRAQGVSNVDWSDRVLGFECGGQQWVNEVALPAGTLSAPSLKDIAFVESLLERLEALHTPAPAPIEQRWTAASDSAMSPAHPRAAGTGPAAEAGSDPAARPLFSWVGIIMYLCTEDARQRKAITDAFANYRGIVARELDEPFEAYVHWAKLEVPAAAEERDALAQRLAARYPLQSFVAARRRLDPKGILSNEAMDVFLAAAQAA
jgi:L-galactono-1,4-lactone dehydrogenase